VEFNKLSAGLFTGVCTHAHNVMNHIKSYPSVASTVHGIV